MKIIFKWSNPIISSYRDLTINPYFWTISQMLMLTGILLELCLAELKFSLNLSFRILLIDSTTKSYCINPYAQDTYIWRNAQIPTSCWMKELKLNLSCHWMACCEILLSQICLRIQTVYKIMLGLLFRVENSSILTPVIPATLRFYSTGSNVEFTQFPPTAC